MGDILDCESNSVLDNEKQITKKISMLPERQAVILLEEYSDFVNVFSKINADILLKLSMYDLAIDIKRRKILLFGLVYNYLRIELQILQDYINKILAKGFITLSKFFH